MAEFVFTSLTIGDRYFSIKLIIHLKTTTNKARGKIAASPPRIVVKKNFLTRFNKFTLMLIKI